MSTVNDQVKIDSDSSIDGEGAGPPIVSDDHGGGVNLGARHPFYGGGVDLGSLLQLVVPAEDLGLDATGEDLDFSQQMLAIVRRPDPQRWFALIKGYWMSTRLLAVASKTSEFGTDWYCVADPAAKAAIRQYMKDVMVVPCYLVHARVWTVWLIPVSATKWYGSVEPLFRLAPEFYTENVFRVLADRSHGCYHVKSELISEMQPPITMPAIQTRTVGELLGEALGDNQFIRSVSHPVVRDLTRGKQVH